MRTVDRHLGTGWAFPVLPDAGRGDLHYRSGAEKVRDALRLILATEPGERVMRPDFGCGLRRFLMEPNTLTTRSTIKRAVQRALERWEPRVRLDTVAVEPGADPAEIHIVVRYSHLRDGSGDVLVYPFYLE